MTLSRSFADRTPPVSVMAAAGALVYRTRHARSAALATCWLVAVSALTTLGTVSQLIAQVVGKLGENIGVARFVRYRVGETQE